MVYPIGIPSLNLGDPNSIILSLQWTGISDLISWSDGLWKGKEDVLVSVRCSGCLKELDEKEEKCPKCGRPAVRKPVPGPHGATPEDVSSAENDEKGDSKKSSDDGDGKRDAAKPAPGPHGAPPKKEGEEVVVPGPHGAPPKIIPR